MKTIDFKKDPTYKATTEPSIINAPKMLFVMVDGQGAPESTDKEPSQFQQAMQIIFGAVYTIKFWDKKHTPPKGYAKFSLAPIEALWWSASGKQFDAHDPQDWAWTAMIRLPEFVTREYFNDVVSELVKTKNSDIYKKVRLEYFNEGTCVQIMHIGPYDKVLPSIEKMHAYAESQGYKVQGKHHELYFSDPRRTEPSKLRTILRHPVQKI